MSHRNGNGKAPVVTLSLQDYEERLLVAKQEIEDLAPAPKVELDRASLLSLIDGALAVVELAKQK